MNLTYSPVMKTILSALMFCSLGITQLMAQPVSDKSNDMARKKAVEKGVAFLRLSQGEDGGWSTTKTTGVTGLCLCGLLDAGVPADDPAVKKAVAYLMKYKQEDGGIYFPQSSHKNYETSICVMALVAANKKGEYTQTIEKAVEFLKKIQWDGDESIDENNPAYGGQGYGGSKRPDLSNTHFFLDAIESAGISHDDPAYKKALVFISRTQNLASENNKTEFADKINDGGFFYTPAGGGSSMAGKTPEGGLRSYGSMTYAGLKSMIHCGLTKDDFRVKAAYDWISKFYSTSENPGMGQAGLYYYYHTMAKALSAMATDEVTSPDGVKHKWKAELLETILKQQQENGSWVNKSDRWYEGDPQLVTGFVLMTLKYCQ